MAGSAPPPPDNIDPGESALEYIKGITNPELQQQILGAERLNRSEYLKLSLQDLAGTVEGYEGQRGALDVLRDALPRIGEMQADALSYQREADIEDVEALGTRATDALRASDPARQALIGQQEQLTTRLYEEAEGVTAQQQRMAEQQAREAGMAAGRGFDESTIASQILGREEFQRQNEMDAQRSGGQLFGMYQATSADPFQALLGRQGTAFGAGQQQQAFGANFAQQGMGPQLYDPNVGINLGMQQNANMANYNAATYGAQAGAKGAMIGGGLAAAGTIGAAMI